ncbi:ABC transporter ATP-binding protein [Paenibacillus athensensis]|uniref:ABC transporter ATP-binding protein n=1 Tax=Paenibacillus athensensis TaxID=1967502 RepID=A0A4Y8PUT0_9BACL|nr:ATP-binding cassette domain-containing protein [Paenibacillus athensensis]
MPIIEAVGLSKEYKQYKRYAGLFGALRSLITTSYTTHKAVDDITFSIEKGEAVGYLGPNGAGKSTMIKMLTGILVPTSGHLTVKGHIPYRARRENAKKIGVVFGQRSQLWWDLPVQDSFELSKHIYKLPVATYRQNFDFCVELLDMKEFIHKPVRQLSLGQRMRAEIAIALLHEPDILFLDEPTIGLDVIAKDKIRTFLRTVNIDRKTTILLTTHDLKDIEEICPRMIIVNRGNIVFDGLVEQLKQQLGQEKTLTIKFSRDPGPFSLSNSILHKDEGTLKTFTINRAERSIMTLLSELNQQYDIEDISIQEPDIEQVIRILYNRLAEDLSSYSSERESAVSWSM